MNVTSLLRRPAPAPVPSARTQPSERLLTRLVAAAPQATAVLSTALGLVTLGDLIGHRHWSLLLALRVFPTAAERIVGELLTGLAVLWLLRVSSGLRRGKRTEWRIAVTATIATGVVGLVREQERPVEVTIAAVLLGWLMIGRHRFTAESDPRSTWLAVRLAFAAVALGCAYAVVTETAPGVPEALVDMLLALGVIAVVATLVLALRPVQAVTTLTDDDEVRLRVLLARHGERDSLGYFALRRDKAAVWSPSGKAAVTYRVVAGVALVSGDPIGDPEAWPAALQEFRALVERYAWTPAVMGCSTLGAAAFRRWCGLSVLELGDEAILDATTFSLDGRAMRGVRQACARVERAGYTARVERVGDLDAARLDLIRTAADAWRVDPVERGYSMALSRLGDSADADCMVVTAWQDGTLHGLLHFVPWGANGLSLDLMRRDRSADNGLNEFMIAAVMKTCPSRGVARVSLNFAVFRDALARGECIGAGPVVRGWRRLLLVASRWWQIDTLYRFNDKFQPLWTPRFVCYPSARHLPRVALAALEAEGFVSRPRPAQRLLARA